MCIRDRPEGLTAYFNDTNAQGDNRDASYLMTEDFTLDSDEDFVVVYGVNHTATGKGQYSNAILYARPKMCIRDSCCPGLFLLPASIELAGAEIELIELEDRTMRLKKLLTPLKLNYDLVLIDCPPSLGLITLNALAASDYLLVPIQCEYYALEGLSQLITTVRQVKRLYNCLLYTSRCV